MHALGETLRLTAPVMGVLDYLSWINRLLAIFNLVPAFPLDGGRVLRSILWHVKGNLRRATRIASNFGTGFGYLLIFLGILAFMTGNLIGGLWWFLIGLFLKSSSQMSYQQLLIKKTFQGEPVSRIMNNEPVTVATYMSVREFVEDHVYRYHYKMFPVMEHDKLVGCVTTRNVRDIPREEWDRHSIREIMQECSDLNSIAPDADAIQALTLMNKTGQSRLMVIDNGELAGVISMKDMLTFLSLKLELEDEE